MKYYEIRIRANISTIRALLKRSNGLKLSLQNRAKCRKFDNKLEKKLAEKEIEAVENKIPHYLT